MVEIPASHRDLLDGQVATLATIGPDGRPQLSEVWFLAEDGTLRLSLNTSRQTIMRLRNAHAAPPQERAVHAVIEAPDGPEPLAANDAK